MADWIGGDGADTSSVYRHMAVRQLRGVSPSYEAVCTGIADDAGICGLIDSLPPPKRQPNLLLGAVRFLDGPVDSWQAFRAFVLERWDDVAATVLERRTQTNEPGRCATLLPLLAALPQPLALLEVGASAGLCLYPDRYAYRYTTSTGGVELGESPVQLQCAVTGAGPLPDRLPDVVWRRGLDLNPLDVRSAGDVRWLTSLVWPEQTHRFAQLEAAVAIARTDPAEVRAGDLTADLLGAASDAPADATLVVFHSAVLAYVPTDEREGFLGQLRDLAAARPTVWISNEAPGVVAGTEQPGEDDARFVLARGGAPLARADPHGRSLEWLG